MEKQLVLIYKQFQCANSEMKYRKAWLGLGLGARLRLAARVSIFGKLVSPQAIE